MEKGVRLMTHPLLGIPCDGELFFNTVAVAAAEFIDASCGIDEFLLTGEERVGSTRDFKFYQRIFFAVDFDSFP